MTLPSRRGHVLREAKLLKNATLYFQSFALVAGFFWLFQQPYVLPTKVISSIRHLHQRILQGHQNVTWYVNLKPEIAFKKSPYHCVISRSCDHIATQMFFYKSANLDISDLQNSSLQGKRAVIRSIGCKLIFFNRSSVTQSHFRSKQVIM